MVPTARVTERELLATYPAVLLHNPAADRQPYAAARNVAPVQAAKHSEDRFGVLGIGRVPSLVDAPSELARIINYLHRGAIAAVLDEEIAVVDE